MKRTMKNALSILLALIMSFAVCLPALAAVPGSASDAKRVYELTELRETNSQTYQLSDGTRECVVYAEDKYYKTADGQLAAIDNTITKASYSAGGKQYAFRNTSAGTLVYFTEDQPDILIEHGGNKLSFSLNDARPVRAVQGGSREYRELFDYRIYGSESLLYPDCLPDTDLIYTVNNSGLKEYLLVKSQSSPGEFIFTFTKDRYGFTLCEDGTVSIKDVAGNEVFALGRLFAVDANGAYSEALTYEIADADADTVRIKIKLSGDYLNDPSRAFPVLIDPSVTVTGASSTYDSYVASSNPTSNYYMDTYVRTGKDSTNGITRTYIKFTLPSGIDASALSYAYIRMKYNSGSTPTVKANRVTGSWSSSSITWNNKPGYTTTNSSAVGTLLSNNWYAYYVTSIVNKWLNGTYTNYGFALVDTNESSTSHWTKFYSSDASSPNKPELVIVYSYGSREYQSVSSTSVNCMGYALELYRNIQFADIGVSTGDFYGGTVDNMLTYINNKVVPWMENSSNIGSGNYGSINAYNSYIESDWFRVCFRAGYLEMGDDAIYNEPESFFGYCDFHWWYQTSDGRWAEKKGTANPSNDVGVSAGADPATVNISYWYNGAYYYASSTKFYKIKDIRNVF